MACSLPDLYSTGRDKGTFGYKTFPFSQGIALDVGILPSLVDSESSFSAGDYGNGYRLPEGYDFSNVRETIFQRVEGLRCACSSLWGTVSCDCPY